MRVCGDCYHKHDDGLAACAWCATLVARCPALHSAEPVVDDDTDARGCLWYSHRRRPRIKRKDSE